VLSSKAPAWRGFIALLYLILPLAGPGGALSVARAEPPAEAQLARWTGDSQPLFTLDDLRKKPVSLADLRGDVLVVHFFATWCEPCREELPALRRLVERSDPRRLQVVTVSVAEVDVRVRNFVEKTPVNFPILLDRDRSVAKAWNVSALPTSFILDRDMKPRLFVEREYDWDSFDVSRALTMFGD
jgi:peroxiredoxin